MPYTHLCDTALFVDVYVRFISQDDFGSPAPAMSHYTNQITHCSCVETKAHDIIVKLAPQQTFICTLIRVVIKDSFITSN